MVLDPAFGTVATVRQLSSRVVLNDDWVLNLKTTTKEKILKNCVIDKRPRRPRRSKQTQPHSAYRIYDRSSALSRRFDSLTYTPAVIFRHFDILPPSTEPIFNDNITPSADKLFHKDTTNNKKYVFNKIKR